MFNELARIIKPHKVMDVTYSMRDEAGILRSYTERRGIAASEKFLEKEHGLSDRDIRDVSYEFTGYDMEAGEWKIEVKAFRDGLTKDMELTENEVKVMNEESGYRLFIVENSWDKHPKVDVIDDVRSLVPEKKEKSVTLVSMSSETYYICNEDIWRAKTSRQRHSNIT